MLASQIISISDLRTHWSKVLESLKDSHKYIVVNNKPKAVLLSCEEYERFLRSEKIRELKEEAEYAAKYGPKFTSGEEMIASLNSH